MLTTSKRLELMQYVSGVKCLETLLVSLYEDLKGEIEFDGLVFSIFNEKKRQLEIAHYAGMPLHRAYCKSIVGLSVDTTENEAIALCFKKGVNVYLDDSDVQDWPPQTQHLFRSLASRSFTLLPIKGSKRVYGAVLFVQQDGRKPAIKDSVIQILNVYAEHVYNLATLSQMKEAMDDLRMQEVSAKRLLSFMSDTSSLHDERELYTSICHEILERFDKDFFALYMLDEGSMTCKFSGSSNKSEFLKIAKAWDEKFLHTSYDLYNNHLFSQCYFNNQVTHIEDVVSLLDGNLSDMDSQILLTLRNPCTLLLAPVRLKQRCIGLMVCANIDDTPVFPDDNLKLICKMGDFIGPALCNAEIYRIAGDQREEIEALNKQLQVQLDKLRIVAATDELTGLANYRSFEDQLERRIAEYERLDDSASLGLVLIDIDHFKRFNDTYGHVSGNLALKTVAACINSVARDMDIPCRYGGEEFSVILPNTSLVGVYTFAERLRVLIEKISIKLPEAVSVTASFGCTCFRKGESVKEFIERADRALYLAKENGRNSVEVADYYEAAEQIVLRAVGE